MEINGIDLDIQGIVESAKQSLIDTTVASVKENVRWQVEQEVGKIIREEIKSFMEKEIVPEIRVSLLGSKTDLLEQVAIESKELARLVVKALTQQISSNLAQTYSAKKIFEALLG